MGCEPRNGPASRDRRLVLRRRPSRPTSCGTSGDLRDFSSASRTSSGTSNSSGAGDESRRVRSSNQSDHVRLPVHGRLDHDEHAASVPALRRVCLRRTRWMGDRRPSSRMGHRPLTSLPPPPLHSPERATQNHQASLRVSQSLRGTAERQKRCRSAPTQKADSRW